MQDRRLEKSLMQSSAPHPKSWGQFIIDIQKCLSYAPTVKKQYLSIISEGALGDGGYPGQSSRGALHTPHVLEEIRAQDWNLVIDVNLKGTFLCCQAVIPEIAKQGKGVIVNMSALAGHWRASLAGVQYVAAKAGVEGLTRQPTYDRGKLAFG